jgi:hypothetical protein
VRDCTLENPHSVPVKGEWHMKRVYLNTGCQAQEQDL